MKISSYIKLIAGRVGNKINLLIFSIKKQAYNLKNKNMKATHFILPLLVLVTSCNNSNNDSNAAKSESKNPDQPITNTTPTVTNIAPPLTNTVLANGTIITIEGKELKLGGSLLVRKDKDKLQPGADYLVMLTAHSGLGSESMVLNFLLALKTGTYPVVGLNFRRGESPHNEMYGGLLGGTPKLTNYKVNITECKDLGSNNMGGHKWSISGSFDELIIPAMGIMLMDKTKNHPAAIKIEKGSFTNLSFDDNWEDMMQQGVKKMQVK